MSYEANIAMTRMFAASGHYVPEREAHRVFNSGDPIHVKNQAQFFYHWWTHRSRNYFHKLYFGNFDYMAKFPRNFSYSGKDISDMNFLISGGLVFEHSEHLEKYILTQRLAGLGT